MEVRSDAKKCGNDAAAEAAAATTPIIQHPMEPKSAAIMDQSKITANDDMMTTIPTTTALTKDEKLVAELRSQLPDVDNIFTIHRRIGEGTFSTVFLTSLKCQEHVPANQKRFFALKYLIPTSHPRRIAQELRCLKEIGGKENVVGVDICLRNNDSIAFVMPYMPHDRFHDYFDRLSVAELQSYMKNLLISLRHVHSFGVIHRDVKPSNFLHDRKNHKFLLVDFGLAQSLDKEFENSTKSITNNNCKENNNDPMPNNEPNDQSAVAIDSSNCDKNSEQPAPPTPSTPNQVLADDCVTVAGDQLDVATRNKRKAAECAETDRMCSTNDTPTNANSAKRPRTDGNDVERNENTSQHQSQQQQQRAYIPSQFKTPLKQMNEISTPKKSKAGDIELNSTIHAAVKSAVVGFSINAKLQQLQRGNTDLMSPDTKLADALSKPVKKSPAMNAITTDRTTLLKPPPRKYNVDNRSSGANVKCFCHGRPTICNVCLVKKEIQATRAGTPGYRSTEVLLKYPYQTQAVDIWAAGVILISILSGCYPFFKGTDDFTALAEIITVFGDKIVKETAYSLGRHVCISRKKRPLHLRKLCIRLRNRCTMQNTPFNNDKTNSTKLMQPCDNCDQQASNCLCEDTDFNTDFTADIYPESVYDLLGKLLAINPNQRISAKDALQHRFFQETY